MSVTAAHKQDLRRIVTVLLGLGKNTTWLGLGIILLVWFRNKTTWLGLGITK